VTCEDGRASGAFPDVGESEPFGLDYLFYLFEGTSNARPDGTLTGLERYVSRREDHRAVSLPGSAAVGWVVARTAGIVQEWKREDTARLE
jgi:hypothetical protein